MRLKPQLLLVRFGLYLLTRSLEAKRSIWLETQGFTGTAGFSPAISAQREQRFPKRPSSYVAKARGRAHLPDHELIRIEFWLPIEGLSRRGIPR